MIYLDAARAVALGRMLREAWSRKCETPIFHFRLRYSSEEKRMPSSASVRFNGIDEFAAERLLAAVWRALEEHALATPLLEVRSANRSIDITLTFQSAGDRALATALAAVKAEVAPSEMRTMRGAAKEQETRHRIKRWRQRADELRVTAHQSLFRPRKRQCCELLVIWN